MQEMALICRQEEEEAEEEEEEERVRDRVSE